MTATNSDSNTLLDTQVRNFVRIRKSGAKNILRSALKGLVESPVEYSWYYERMDSLVVGGRDRFCANRLRLADGLRVFEVPKAPIKG